jgi:hypothetical protein
VALDDLAAEFSLTLERDEAKAPFGHWNTMTFLAALRHDRIDATWVVDGPINSSSFRHYVEKILVVEARRSLSCPFLTRR